MLALRGIKGKISFTCKNVQKIVKIAWKWSYLKVITKPDNGVKGKVAKVKHLKWDWN